MRLGLYWYSATGNTLNLARAAVDVWTALGHSVTAFDMLNEKGETPPSPDSFDKVVFAFPVMIFRPPLVARRFAGNLPTARSPVPAHIMITSGGMGARSDSVFAEILEKKGLNVRSAVELVCEDSYIPFRKWFGSFNKKALPDEGTRKAAETFAREVATENLEKPFAPLGGLVRNFFAGIGKNAPEDAGRSFLGPRELQAERCTCCGLCARLCPTGAIVLDGGHPVVTEKSCVGCCACFNNCPTDAWRLGRFALKYHYRLPEKQVWRGL